MSSNAVDPQSTGAAPLTLAARRPGHAVMAHLLAELDRRGAGTRVPADLLSWCSGAEGELLVGQELARLPEGWAVLHAVPAGPVADIDHLLVGPGGVIVVNTKRHPGQRVRVGTHRVWISGRREEFYQRDLLSRARKVAAILAPWIPAETVRPLLVFVDTASLTAAGEQTVGAVRASALVDHLLALPPVLAPALVHGLATVVSRPATWGRPASVLHEPDPTARFLALTAAPAPAPAAVEERPSALEQPHAPHSSGPAIRSCTSTPTRAVPAERFDRILVRTLAAATAVLVVPPGLVVVLAILQG